MPSAIDPETIVSADVTNDEVKAAFVIAKAEISALQGARLVVQATTPKVLLAADTGLSYSNEGATAKILFTLPTPVAGQRFSFIVQDADGLRVTAAASATIRNAASVSAANGYIENTTIGSHVSVTAINATQWFVTSALGTWTPV